MSTLVDEGAVERFSRLDSCTVSDALDTIGIHGVLRGVSRQWVCRRVVGRAIIVRLVPVGEASEPHISRSHLGAAAIERSSPGDVIVVDNGGREGNAGWGGILSMAAQLAGVAGVVVNGAVRDLDEAIALGFPIFSTAIVSCTARGRVVEVSDIESLHMSGVNVRDGDIVVADASGVVVVPQESESEVLACAERLQRKESNMARRIREGERVSSVLGQNYERALEEEQ